MKHALLKSSAALLAAALCAGCSGVSVQFGDMNPLPGVDEWFNPESPMDVEVASYRYDCGTKGELTTVTLLPDLKAVEAWQSENQFQLMADGSTPVDQPYALIELGARDSGDGFAVSRSGGRRGSTAYIKITGLSFSSHGKGEGPAAPCALVTLPRGKWERVRVVDQVSGMKTTSAPLP